MKLKKSHIFFICYYATATIGTLLTVALLWEHRLLSFYSFVPCFSILGLILFACHDPLHRNLNDEAFKPFAIAVWKLCIPIPLPFIFFFPDMGKCLSCLVIAFGMFVIKFYGDFKIKKESEKQHKASLQERKRQEQLEELGKWK